MRYVDLKIFVITGLFFFQAPPGLAGLGSLPFLGEALLGGMATGTLQDDLGVVDQGIQGVWLGVRLGIALPEEGLWVAIEGRVSPVWMQEHPGTGELEQVWRSVEVGALLGSHFSLGGVPLRVWLGGSPWQWVIVNRHGDFYRGTRWKGGFGYFFLGGASLNLEWSFLSFSGKQVADIFRVLKSSERLQGQVWDLSVGWVF